jgi:hypothetical protein
MGDVNAGLILFEGVYLYIGRTRTMLVWALIHLIYIISSMLWLALQEIDPSKKQSWNIP